MKKLTEFVTIKNLNTDETTTVDDEGNIEGLDGEAEGFDFFSGEDDGESHGLRPDGSHDGLDDLGSEFADLDDPFGEEAPTDELPAEEDLEGEG